MPTAAKGSQMWLQRLVNSSPDLFRKELCTQIGIDAATEFGWRSPLLAEEFKEYRDLAALARIDVRDPKCPLNRFWPARGPVWDALGVASNRIPVLVEAKAHIPEMLSPPSKASVGPIQQIEKSLASAKRYYGVSSSIDWAGVFYQYANRLAFHYYLEKLNGIQNYLVFVYFLNASDVDGPTEELEWNGAIRLMTTFLGLGSRKLHDVHHVFIDCRRIAG